MKKCGKPCATSPKLCRASLPMAWNVFGTLWGSKIFLLTFSFILAYFDLYRTIFGLYSQFYSIKAILGKFWVVSKYKMLKIIPKVRVNTLEVEKITLVTLKVTRKIIFNHVVFWINSLLIHLLSTSDCISLKSI